MSFTNIESKTSKEKGKKNKKAEPTPRASGSLRRRALRRGEEPFVEENKLAKAKKEPRRGKAKEEKSPSFGFAKAKAIFAEANAFPKAK